MYHFIASLLLIAFWFLLTEGNLYSLFVGVFFIILSIYASFKLTDKNDKGSHGLYINVMKLPKFIIFFLYQSIKGGVSTAQRVFAIKMNLQPNFIHYPIKHLPSGLPMNLFMNIVSLLPGSVSVIREPTGVLVHVLTVSNDTLAEIYDCELAICALFNIETSPINTDSIIT